MEFSAVVRARRMVRNYDPDRTVPRATIDRLLGYAVRAPSAGFSQGWQFMVLDQPADRELFWSATTQPDDPAPDRWLRGIQSAPVLIIALSDKAAYLDRYASPDKGWTDRDEARWPVPYWDIDTGMASLLILLGAVDEGLSACFFGVPPEHHDRARVELGIAAGLRFVGVISLGYGVADRRSPSLARGRRDLTEVVQYGPNLPEPPVTPGPTGS